MNSSPPSAPGDSLAEDAAYWCTRLHDEDCSEGERQAFQRWLATPPEHAREFAEMMEIWEAAVHLPPTTGTRVAPRPLAPAARPRRHSRLRRAGLTAAIALLTLPLAGYGGWLMGWIPDSYRQYAARDATRRVRLPDGSEVELNLRTALSFANYRDRRSVSLKEGEAWFKVSHDARHPFVVEAGPGTIMVTGTQFNVWKYRDSVTVTVTEGSVRVDCGRERDRCSSLTANMQASYWANEAPAQMAAVDTASVLAWRDGKLILDDLPLAEALPLINRYLDAPIRLGDAAAARLRLGGIYDTGDIQGLVRNLPNALPVRIDHDADGSLVLSSR
ncbi:FecR family protein [Azotobacter armeniacus]